MLSVFVLDRLKSPAAAFVPAAAATVSVTASLDARFNVAVTVAFPGFVPSCSSIVSALSASVAVGVASSSVRVRLAPVTVPTPWLFCAVPLTVTDAVAHVVHVVVHGGDRHAVRHAFDVSPAAISIVASSLTV